MGRHTPVYGKRMFPEPRIVGGANAASGNWPWQISLRQWRTSIYLHICGAAVLNENWAIIAAHFIGQTAFVNTAGWGTLYEDGPLPSVLQEVYVPVINNTICETMYRGAGYIKHIPHIFISAGWENGGYDSCEGEKITVNSCNYC